MARSSTHSVQASPITLTKSQRPRISSRPSQLNTSQIKKHWSRPRNDTPLLVHSAGKINDSDDSLVSSSASNTSSPSEGGECRSLSIAAAKSNPMSRERPWNSELTAFDGGGDRPRGFAGTSKSQVHAKPLPEKGFWGDAPSIKPSQSSVEQDDSGGCMIAGNAERQRDSPGGFNARRPVHEFHHRSTTSQIYTMGNSRVSKPDSQCFRQARPAPRSYITRSHSYHPSVVESDVSEDSDYAEGQSASRSSADPFQPFARTQAPRLSLQIHDGSFTPAPAISQTNVTGRSSFGYARDNNGSVLDTPSPISRSSLDFVFRSKTRASVDPVSRAATVQAARQAFEEKEEAKTRKFEEQQIKAEEKQERRKEKQYWRTSMRDEEVPSPTPEEVSEKPDTTGTSHPTPGPQPPQPTSTFKTWKSRSKNTWMLFMIWLRTRVFKLRRRLRRTH